MISDILGDADPFAELMHDIEDAGFGGEQGGDYVEEKTTKDGRHIHKEVHNSNGHRSVHIRMEGGPGGGIMMGGGPMGGPGGLIGAMMNDMMRQMDHVKKRKPQTKQLGDGSEESKKA